MRRSLAAILFLGLLGTQANAESKPIAKPYAAPGGLLERMLD